MNSSIKLLATTALIASTDAKWNSCSAGDYMIGVKAFNQGFQNDILNMSTDCFDQTWITMASTRTFFDSFYYYSHTDFLAPLYRWADLGIEITNALTYCETVNFAKQMAIRTTSWGGLIEMVLTIVMAFARNASSAGSSTLYNAFDVAFVSGVSCTRSARAAGQMLSLILSVQTPDETYYENLVFSLQEFDESSSSTL